MIREAVRDDAEALAEVHTVTWQAAYDGILPSGFLDALDRWQRREWWGHVIGRGETVFVADVDGVVGFCFTGPCREDDTMGEVFAIYVHPDHWGEGHGHRLLAAGESHLRRQGFERAILWVLEANEPSRRFYERQGWKLAKPFRVEEIGGTPVTEVSYRTEL